MYFLQSAFKSIRKNYLMTIASVFVLMACMLIIGSAYLCSANIASFMESLGEKNEIVAYVDETVDSSHFTEIQERIEAIDYVYEVTFVPKETALEEYQQQFGSEGEYLSWFYGDENPLRDEFRIQVDENHLDAFEDIAARIAGMEEIANTSDSQEVVNVLLSLKKVMDILGFWIMIILALVSWFIVSNTIKLAMYNRRHEINIMKYVGATDWFIRWPFILEGMTLGFFGALIANFVINGTYAALLSRIYATLAFLPMVPAYPMLTYVDISIILAGTAIGAAGSYISLRKFLKV